MIYLTLEDILEIHRTILHSIICNHPFADGNKRTGFSAMDVFLRLNDQGLVAEEDEKYDFVQGIASGAIPFSEVSIWISQRLKRG